MIYTYLYLVNHWMPRHGEWKSIHNFLNDVHKLREIKKLTLWAPTLLFSSLSMHWSYRHCSFVWPFFFENTEKWFCHLKSWSRNLLGVLCFLANCDYFIPSTSGFVTSSGLLWFFLRNVLIMKNYFNDLLEGFWILIVHYIIIV